MTTKELITILERELGTVKSNNVVDKARDEIIRRLEELDELKKIMNEVRLTIDELVEEREKIKQLFKV